MIRNFMLTSEDRHNARAVFLLGIDTFDGACRRIIARKIETGWLPKRRTVTL